MSEQKTLDRHTAKFIASICESMSPLDTDIMQAWIQNPKELTLVLMEALNIPRRWREESGIIYLSVTSDGTTGPQWIERLEKRGFEIADIAKQVLLSDDFKSTSGVTYNVAILKETLFEDNDRSTRNVRDDADHRNLVKPNAEVAPLIRDKFSKMEIELMGLRWIVPMHEPIYCHGYPEFLNVGRAGRYGLLGASHDTPGCTWPRGGGGFAFVVSSTSAPM